jgi:hypothetical protein
MVYRKREWVRFVGALLDRFDHRPDPLGRQHDGDGQAPDSRRSKTDQEGAGAVVAVCRGSIACPVTEVKEWLVAASIVEGPVFRQSIALSPGLSKALAACANPTHFPE